MLRQGDWRTLISGPGLLHVVEEDAGRLLGGGRCPSGGADRFGPLEGASLRDGDIRISLGGVGGPSAGLMFALAVVDKLTPGDLADGRFVAGTGAIEPTGTVRPINGVPFKMRRAYDEGATVFLVPDANCEEAAAANPGDLQLVRVGTLHDAVAALQAMQAGGPVPSC